MESMDDDAFWDQVERDDGGADGGDSDDGDAGPSVQLSVNGCWLHGPNLVEVMLESRQRPFVLLVHLLLKGLQSSDCPVRRFVRFQVQSLQLFCQLQH